MIIFILFIANVLFVFLYFFYSSLFAVACLNSALFIYLCISDIFNHPLCCSVICYVLCICIKSCLQGFLLHWKLLSSSQITCLCKHILIIKLFLTSDMQNDANSDNIPISITLWCLHASRRWTDQTDTTQYSIFIYSKYGHSSIFVSVSLFQTISVSSIQYQ